MTKKEQAIEQQVTDSRGNPGSQIRVEIALQCFGHVNTFLDWGGGSPVCDDDDKGDSFGPLSSATIPTNTLSAPLSRRVLFQKQPLLPEFLFIFAAVFVFSTVRNAHPLLVS